MNGDQVTHMYRLAHLRVACKLWLILSTLLFIFGFVVCITASWGFIPLVAGWVVAARGLHIVGRDL